MPAACDKSDGGTYAHTSSTSYQKYVTKHNPAVFWDGIACTANDIPSGDWQNQQGALYSDLTSGNLPAFSFVQPNDIENGHDPVSVAGVTIAGGKSQIANIDNYLAGMLSLVQSSPDYESGNLVVMITFDEGTIAGNIPGEDSVGENCADPNISPAATSCQVQTWIVGRYVPNYTYMSYMNQFGLLAATERVLGLPTLLGHAADCLDAGYRQRNLVESESVQPDAERRAAPADRSGCAHRRRRQRRKRPARSLLDGPHFDGRLTDHGLRGAGSRNRSDHLADRSRSDIECDHRDDQRSRQRNGYDVQVSAVNTVGAGAPSTVATGTPTAAPPPPTELLPDPGFESGVGGWKAFLVGNLATVSAPVHSGSHALQVTAPSSSANLVGLTQNTVVANSVAGRNYTASCWVDASAANLNEQIRFLEYNQSLLHPTSTPRPPSSAN